VGLTERRHLKEPTESIAVHCHTASSLGVKRPRVAAVGCQGLGVFLR
jgi:hypothetical protein